MKHIHKWKKEKTRFGVMGEKLKKPITMNFCNCGRAEQVKAQDDYANWLIYKAIFTAMIGQLTEFDAYLKKQNVPKIYKRFKQVIEII